MDKKEKEIQIKEARGLWKASSYIHKLTKRLKRRREPIRLRYLLEAHKILFSETNERDVGGKYRRSNPTIRCIDNTKLIIPSWAEVPNKMANLDEELKIKTPQLSPPLINKDYVQIIDLAIKTSHRLACIHPFHNGNGRISRLLIDFILLRASLFSIAIKEDKSRYLRAMLQADKGDFGLLRRLVIRGLVEAQNKKIQRQRNLLMPKGKQKQLVLHKSDFK